MVAQSHAGFWAGIYGFLAGSKKRVELSGTAALVVLKARCGGPPGPEPAPWRASGPPKDQGQGRPRVGSGPVEAAPPNPGKDTLGFVRIDAFAAFGSRKHKAALEFRLTSALFGCIL